MPSMEAALAQLEEELAAAQKSIESLNKVVRRVRAAAKSGQLAEIEKGLEAAKRMAIEAARSTERLGESWQFDGRSYLETGYLGELRESAEAAGLKLFEKDGRIYCFPLLLRLEPREAAVLIGKKRERRIRPKELARLLTGMQKRPQRFKEQQFLELLYQAYKLRVGTEWQTTGSKQGPAVPVVNLHAVLTLLPGSDYSLEELGRDLLLLDRQPELRTKDGWAFQFPGSTMGKSGVRRVTIYDEEGRERTYVGIRFSKGD